MERMIRAVLVLACISVFCGLSNGGTVFEAAMVRYVNNGRDADGDKCDYIFNTACDHQFVFCFDVPTGGNSMNTCPYGRVSSRVYGGQNTVVFGNSLASGVSNPIALHIDNWLGGIRMKVHVVDSDDTSGDDRVDDLFVTYRATPDASLAFASPHPVTITGTRSNSPTKLEVEFAVYCADDYYGVSCTTFCHETDDVTGHYVCDPDTGQKVCRLGWEGQSVNCTIYSDDCRDVTCLNGGSCIDGNQAYTCACLVGFTGVHCEQDIDECASAPCFNNGSCVDGVNSFECSCMPGYVGSACQYHVCNVSVTCLNNGTCVGDGQCACPDGFTGSLCETDMCDLVTCQNNGTCYQGHCVCPSGVAGYYCSVDLCDYIYCLNDATCMGGGCICPIGFAGTRCERNTNECLSNPCGRTGVCEDHVSGYVCHCAEHYTGRLCETPLEVITYPDFHLPDQAHISIVEEKSLPNYGLALLAAATILVVIMMIWMAVRCFASRRHKKEAETNEYDNPVYARNDISTIEGNNNVLHRQTSRDSATNAHTEPSAAPPPDIDCYPDKIDHPLHADVERVTFNNMHDSNESVSYYANEEDICDVTVTSFENPIYDTLPAERRVPSVVDQVVADGLIRDKDSADNIVLIQDESEA